MIRCLRLTNLLAVSVLATMLLPNEAYAYGGPGSLISGVGAMLAVIVALGASIFGFIWFPLKRLARKLAAFRGTRDGSFGEDLSEDLT